MQPASLLLTGCPDDQRRFGTFGELYDFMALVADKGVQFRKAECFILRAAMRADGADDLQPFFHFA